MRIAGPWVGYQRVLAVRRVGAVEHHAADLLGVAAGEDLGEEGAVGVAVDVDRAEPERVDHGGEVVGRQRGRVVVGAGAERRAARGRGDGVGDRAGPAAPGSRSARSGRCRAGRRAAGCGGRAAARTSRRTTTRCRWCCSRGRPRAAPPCRAPASTGRGPGRTRSPTVTRAGRRVARLPRPLDRAAQRACGSTSHGRSVSVADLHRARPARLRRRRPRAAAAGTGSDARRARSDGATSQRGPAAHDRQPARAVGRGRSSTTSCATASSLGANGPGRKCGLASPRCTDSQAAQSCRLVMSQNSTAPGGLRHRAVGAGQRPATSTRPRSGPGASGTIRCVIT